MKVEKKQRSCGTHDGTFHADEVTACALLLLYGCIDLDKIVRTRDLNVLNRCDYVCDVGGVYDPRRRLFDHHQADYRGNLSSAGMVLQYLKEEGKISEKEYEFFNESLILGVDAHDNGKEIAQCGVCTYSDIISHFNPVLYDSGSHQLEEAFSQALAFASKLLNQIQKRFQYIQSCRQIVEEVMANSHGCLLFEQNIPWLEIFFELGGSNHPALFVIMPSGRHWKLRGIPPTAEQKMQVRLPLPLEWAGLLDEELKKVTGIPGAIFCHKGRFISVWETREDAIKALEYVWKLQKITMS